MLLTPSPLYEVAKARLFNLQYQKDAIEEKVPKYSPGRIHIVRKKDNNQFYLRTDPKDKSGTYVSKKDKKTLKTYLQKRYYEETLKLVDTEIKMIEKFVENSEFISQKIRMLYSKEHPEIKQYLTPIDMSDEDYIANWLAIPYEKKDITGVPDDYTTEKGEIVRSKSELNIANYLCLMNIPYRYECKLTFSDGYHIYPDFTILDVKRRREVYWEHRGMMDDLEYACNSVERIKRYNRDGLFLGDSLIITEETLHHHLGTSEIKSIIAHYFI